MQTVNEFYVFLTRLNSWAFEWLWNRFLLQLLKVSFEEGAHWHSGNYRVYIHSKMHMQHDKNTQFLAGLPFFRFSMLEQLQSHLARIGSKPFPFISSEKSFLSKKTSREKSCLPNWFTINIPHGYRLNALSYNICHWVDIYRLL